MITQHMRYTASAVVPTGDFLAHVVEWTGLPPAQLLGLMRGASPVSAGASAELERLIAAIQADPEAQALLASDDDPAATLEALRSRDGETGAAMTAYLDLVGNRLLDGFDISEPSALELPDQLLRAIRTATEADAEDHDIDAQHRRGAREGAGRAPGRVRRAARRSAAPLPPPRRARGLQRHLGRPGSCAGRRSAPGGAPRRPGGSTSPSTCSTPGSTRCRTSSAAPAGRAADELAARAAYRTSHTAKDAPATLGPPAPPPPDPSGLPPGVGRLMQATGIALGALFGSSEAEHEEAMLRGLAASTGVYEGTARLIESPTEFGRIVKGDVLVTVSTTEAFNILLPLLGAIVTDSGGLLSHSAIVAREYGIPGVVGTREATSRILDGARVRVDGNAGEVTVLA